MADEQSASPAEAAKQGMVAKVDQAFTINGANGKPMVVTPALLETMGHGDLQMLRKVNESNQAVQQKLSPFEHQAWAREYTQENPISGALAVPVLTAGYTAAKLPVIRDVAQKFGLVNADATPASFDQLRAGFAGMKQGLMGTK